MIYFDESFVLDSFKIRIPLNQVKIIDNMVCDYLIVHKTSGEILERAYKKNAYMYFNNGIKYYLAIETKKTELNFTIEYLVILVTAKILKQDYLDGITLDNIEKLYNEIISLGVVEFTYLDFLNGQLTDVDFKQDVKYSDFDKVINHFYDTAKDQYKSNEIIRKYNRSIGGLVVSQGVQFSKRQTTSIDVLPFIKFYNKGIDLTRNKDNIEFFENYLLDKKDLIDNRIRIEYTIKNKKHFKKFGVADTSLKNILSLTSEEKLRMYMDIISKYYDFEKVKPIKIKDGFNPNDVIVIQAISMLIQYEDMNAEKIVHLLTEEIKQKQTRYRKRKELMLLYNEAVKLHHKEKIERINNKNLVKDFLQIPVKNPATNKDYTIDNYDIF